MAARTDTSGISASAVAALLAREQARFGGSRSESQRLARECAPHWLNGVPQHWMLDWPTPFPVFVRSASGSTLIDVDGIRYADFCLGDSGAMYGHSPPAVAAALASQAGNGLHAMLPDERVAGCGRLLAERFGLPCWQMTLTATDANRAALRHARALTGRQRIVVFDGCYHGTVEETMVRQRDGRTLARPGQIGPAFDIAEHSVAVDFNDIAALEAALASDEYAALLCEPVMTNAGMVLPEPGFLEQARSLCSRHGTLLIIDETHTLSSGPGGYARLHGPAADLLVCGKAVAGGVPCAVLGFSAEVAGRAQALWATRSGGHSGMGTTLSANMLAMAALHASLTQLMTAANHARMDEQAARLAGGLQACFARHGLAWCVARVGARVEFGFAATPPRNARAALQAQDPALEQALHLYLLNRGVLMTPFHNMMLVAPATGQAQVDALLAGLDAALTELRS